MKIIYFVDLNNYVRAMGYLLRLLLEISFSEGYTMGIFEWIQEIFKMRENYFDLFVQSNVVVKCRSGLMYCRHSCEIKCNHICKLRPTATRPIRATLDNKSRIRLVKQPEKLKQLYTACSKGYRGYNNLTECTCVALLQLGCMEGGIREEQ